MNTSIWPSASPDNRCPKCDKENRCKIAPDGKAGICWRSGSSKVWHDSGPDNPVALPRRSTRPTRPKTNAVYPSPEHVIKKLLESSNNPTLAGQWKYPADVMRVLRFNFPDGSKQYRPIHRTIDEQRGLPCWTIGDPPGLLPLYRIDEIPPDGPVHVCEGEKAADHARSIGLIAVTSAHGSAAADKSDWQPLTGRDIVILPDADRPGEKYAARVSEILQSLGCKVKIVRLPGLAKGGDIVDFDATIGSEPATTKSIIEELTTKEPYMNTIENERENESDRLLSSPMLLRLADVQGRAIRWLWRGRIPLGRITLLVGRPGEGKSFFTMDAAARISTGSPWPDGSPGILGSVLIISGEDDPADTIQPRLLAHHADLSRVHLLSGVRRHDAEGKPFEMMFSLIDLDSLESALKQLGDCKLIIVDPIGSFLGGDVDGNSDNKVRSILAPLARLAEQYGPAILIVAHRRKSGGNSADDLAMGSRAFTGIARAVWHLTRDRDDKSRRLLLPGKNNLAAEGTGLAFTIVGDPPNIAWEKEAVEMNADEALAMENAGGADGESPETLRPRQAADEWLRLILANGELPTATIQEQAQAAGMNFRTIQRAAREMGVISEINPYSRHRQWRFSKPAAAA